MILFEKTDARLHGVVGFALPVVIAVLLFALSAPYDRSEAEDAFDYAWRVEHGSGAEALLHPHHLLYLPLMKGFHVFARFAGWLGGAHALMCLVGSLCGGLCVGLLAVVLRRCCGCGSSHVAAWAPAAGLAVSYGFWRYASEAEVYVPALAAVLLAWVLASRANTLARSVWVGLAGGTAALLHVFNIVPALIALPLYMALDGRRRQAVVTAFSVFVVFGLAYVVAAALQPSLAGHVFSVSSPTRGVALPRATDGLRAVAGFAQTFASGNFLLGFDWFRARLVGLFPGRMLDEELWLGMHAPALSRLVPFVTLAAAGICGVGLLCMVLPRGPGRSARGRGGPALMLAAGAWFLIHTGLVLVCEPGNPEMWIHALVPLWMAGGAAFAGRAVGRGMPRGALAALVLLLGTHNWFGGMALLRDREGGYLGRKAEWLVRNASQGDMVLTADSVVFVRYLRYHASADVRHLGTSDLHELRLDMDAVAAAGRSVYACGDVFVPPRHIGARSLRALERVSGFALQLKDGCLPVRRDPFGGVYAWRPAP